MDRIMISRRNALTAAAALAAGIAAVIVKPAAAQSDFPSRPIKMMVPFTAGGGTDILARALASKMSENMKQSVVVENRPGGNTLLATQVLARSPADGYTLLMQTNNLASNPTLYGAKAGFDTVRDLVPVSLVAGNPHVLVVTPSLPARTLKDYLELGRASPDRITYGSAGSGTVNHLAAEQLAMLAGVKLLHVPYKGSGSVMPDLLGGQLNSLVAAMPNVRQHIEAGRLRALAVTTLKRFPGLPDVPTVAESGYPGFDFQSWFGVVAPGGTPPAIITRLNTEIRKALADPGVIERLGNYVVYASSPEEFAEFLGRQIEASARLIKALGVTVD